MTLSSHNKHEYNSSGTPPSNSHAFGRGPEAGRGGRGPSSSNRGRGRGGRRNGREQHQQQHHQHHHHHNNNRGEDRGPPRSDMRNGVGKGRGSGGGGGGGRHQSNHRYGNGDYRSHQQHHHHQHHYHTDGASDMAGVPGETGLVVPGGSLGRPSPWKNDTATDGRDTGGGGGPGTHDSNANSSHDYLRRYSNRGADDGGGGSGGSGRGSNVDGAGGGRGGSGKAPGSTNTVGVGGVDGGIATTSAPATLGTTISHKRPAPPTANGGDESVKYRRRNDGSSAGSGRVHVNGNGGSGSGSSTGGNRTGRDRSSAGSRDEGGRARGNGSKKERRSNSRGDRGRQKGDAAAGSVAGGGVVDEKDGGPDGKTVTQRREAKQKELRSLDKKKRSAVAAGEALAKEVEKNRLEQEEIAIQMDAANRILALYDSTGSASRVALISKSQLSGSSRAGAADPVTTPTPRSSLPSSSSSAVSRHSRGSPLRTSAASGATGVTPVPSESSRPRVDSTIRGRGGAALRGRVSNGAGGSGLLGVPSPAATATAARGARLGSGVSALQPDSSRKGASKVSKKTHKDVSKKKSKKDKARKSRKKSSKSRSRSRSSRSESSSSSSSSSDEDSSSGGSDNGNAVNGVGRNGNSLFGFITSMPPRNVPGSADAGGWVRADRASTAAVGTRVRKSPLRVDTLNDFPTRVPNDAARGGVGARSTGSTAAVAARGGGAGGTGTAGGSSGGGRSGSASHRGVEVNVGSFNILKQLMFKTQRSHKPRSMVFNPKVPGLFAVCSADLSVDLWRYDRTSSRMNVVSLRNDVTPTGGAHMAWNPSGSHLAIGHTGTTLTNDWAATIISRDGSRSSMKLRSDRHTKPAQAVAWVTPSKNYQDHLVTGGEDGHVVIWTRVLDSKSDLHKVAILHSKHSSAVRSACCPSISPTVVSGGADGRLVSYSIETASVQWEELLRVSNSYHPQVNELLEFPNNPHSLLVSAVDTARSHSMFTMDTRQNPNRIHNATRMSWKRKDEKHAYSSFVYPSISPCGRYVACAGDWNGCFNIWDVRSGRTDPMQTVLVNSLARVMHTAWHIDAESRALMSLSAASGQSGKNFALHLHGGLTR